MLDIRFIRENQDIIKENMKKKFASDDDISKVDVLLQKDEEFLKLLQEAESLRHQRNEITGKINETRKTGGDITELLAQAKEIPQKIKQTEERQTALQEEIKKILLRIPNIMHDSVPLGKDDSENVELETWGEKPSFSFPIKNHVELLEKLNLADFDTAAKVSGNGFYFLKGDLGLLNQALIRFAIDFMQTKGYQYVEPPLMLRKEVLDAAMDTEGFKETIYSVEGEDLHLIGTSEHALLGLHAGQAIPENELPKKYFSYSMCFRKEVGAHGINEKGLWRTHQFNKVEQFVFCKPDDSYKFYDELLANTKELFQELGLPYRHIECCSGDLATWKAKSSDIEVWRPTTNAYGEVTSLTNCTDFQARGLGIRIVYNDGNRAILHTLNNTAIATSRAMVAIIENYQNEDGSITVPPVLRPYMNNKERITAND